MDFFLNFILIPFGCTLLTAISAAPLGCLMTWRRMIYLGEALSHASLLGIALALWLKIPLYIGIWSMSIALILLLNSLKKRSRTDANNILGTLAHIMLAGGIIAISQMENVRTDLLGYLFGDVLNTTQNDLLFISLISISVLTIVKFIWNPLIFSTTSETIAQVEYPQTHRIQLIFTLLLGIYIGVMIQFLGLLLVMAFLIIPVQTALLFAKTPEHCSWFAMLFASCAATLGFFVSYHADLPTAPTIALCAGSNYFLLLIIKSMYRKVL